MTDKPKKRWTFTPLSDEEKCEAIDKYLGRKIKEINEAQSILLDIKETTNSTSEDKAPAVSITKTSKQYLKDSLPSIVDFSVEVGFSTQSIYKWYTEGKLETAPEERQYFANKVDALKSLSQKAIIDARNMGYIDPIFAKFLLSAWHGYSEKTEVDSKATLNIQFDNSFNNDSPTT